jgi:hypothetical protein
VNSSTNIVRASPLSNVVVAGIVDPGRGSACIVSEAKPNKTSAPENFVQVVFVTVDRTALAGINDPGYSLNRRHRFGFGASDMHSLE